MLGSTVPGAKLTLLAVGGVTVSEEINTLLPGAVALTGLRLTRATSPGGAMALKQRRPRGPTAPPVVVRVSTRRWTPEDGTTSVLSVSRWSTTRSIVECGLL